MRSPRRIRELVRQFKENGMKMMLEDPANVRDVLGLLDVAWRDDIDFSHLDQVKTTFIRRDYRHLASDLMENSVQDEATRQEVVKMRKTGAEALMERGAQKAGLLTRRQTLVRQLRKRFGSVPSDVVRVVEATDDVERLDDWLDRFATAQTLEELGIREQK